MTIIFRKFLFFLIPIQGFPFKGKLSMTKRSDSLTDEVAPYTSSFISPQTTSEYEHDSLLRFFSPRILSVNTDG